MIGQRFHCNAPLICLPKRTQRKAFDKDVATLVRDRDSATLAKALHVHDFGDSLRLDLLSLSSFGTAWRFTARCTSFLFSPKN